MVTDFKQDTSAIRTEFRSEEVGKQAIDMLRDSEVAHQNATALLGHMAIELFYNQKRGYLEQFGPTRSVNILGEDMPIGTIMVAAGYYLALCGEKFHRRVNKFVQEKTIRSPALNFPALQMNYALGHPSVIEGIVQTQSQLQKDDSKEMLPLFFVHFAHILVGLAENGERHLCVAGSTGINTLFPENASREDKIKFVHLAIVENIAQYGAEKGEVPCAY